MRLAFIALALALLTPPAFAVTDEASARRDCASDALRYCAVELFQGRASVIRCMKRSRSKLSPACRSHFQ